MAVPMMRYPGLLAPPQQMQPYPMPAHGGMLTPRPMAPPVPMAPAGGFDPWPTKPPTGLPPTGAGRFGEHMRERFSDIMAPEVMMPVAAALMAGDNWRESAAGAMSALGQGVVGKRRRSRTVEMLAKEDPKLAEWVESGAIDAKDAFSIYAMDRKARASQAGEVDSLGFPKAGSMSQKIRAYQMQGFDANEALKLASGRYEISVNPMTGERVMVDTASQQIIPLKQPQYADGAGGGQTAPAVPPQGKTLWDMAEKGTGVASTIQRGLSDTAGQLPGALGDMMTFPATVEATQNLELFKRNLIQSLSLNPRFPVAEQQRIENLLPRGAMTSPDTLRTSMQALDQELARIEMMAAAGMNDPRATVDQRQADQQTLRWVREARQRMGVPGSTYAPQGGGGRRTGTGIQWSVDQ